MTLLIKYFGMTTEASGKKEEELLNQYSSITELKKYLLMKYPELVNMNFKIAVNQLLIDGD